MASTKSVEDILLSSDIDESAVHALVGSLESQLADPSAPYTRPDVAMVPNADGAFRTAKKQGPLIGSLLDRGSPTATKTFVGPQSVTMSPVVVTGTGPQVTGGFVNASYAQGLTPGPAPDNLKVMYTTTTLPPTATNNVQYTRTNVKLQNGGSTPTVGLIRNGPTPVQIAAPMTTTSQVVTAIPQQRKTVPTAVKDNSTILQPQTAPQFIQVAQTIPSQPPTTFSQNVITQPVVIPSSKGSTVVGTPVNVMSQPVSNPQTVPGIHVVNVNQARFGSSNIQRTLAPRVVIGNQIRIAPMIRHSLSIPGQNAIALPPGLRGTIYVKSENGQFQVVNLGSAMPSSALSQGSTAYRIQSVNSGTPGGVRAFVPQQIAVAPVSSSKSTPAESYHSGHKSDYGSNVMTPEQGKSKCKNFLATLLKLASEQPKKVATNVKKLIQALIDGAVAPEEFTTKLQKELNSSPQPCLVPFLRKSLPFLRHAMITKEVSIDGVNPPPPSTLIPAGSTVALSQADQLRPVLTQPVSIVTTTVSPIAVTTTASVLTAQLSQPASVLPAQVLNTPRLIHPVTSHNVPRINTPLNGSYLTTKPLTTVSSITTTYTTLPKPAPAKTSVLKSTPVVKDRKVAPVRDEDDINDVAAMGGVNLLEESQKILATNSELVGTQIRSCKDDNYMLGNSFHNKISSMVRKAGIPDLPNETVALISHAAQERMKNLISSLAIVAEHRMDNAKADPQYQVTQDVRGQIKFLEELDRLEKKKHEEQEREILLRAAKSRSKLEDPEQLKLKQKAKEMQKAEIEELRQREANMTALLAIGPRKKAKLEMNVGSSSPMGSSSSGGLGSSFSKPIARPRIKRVNFRDLMFVMEQDRDPSFKKLIFKSCVK